MGEIGEGDECLPADAQQFLDHAIRAAGGLERLAEDRIVEAGLGIIDEIGVGIALDHGKPTGYGGGDIMRVDFQAAGIDLFRIAQRSHQGAVAAADVKNAGAGRDGAGDEGQIGAQAHARPPFRKPSTTRFNSGHSSRKASWPKGLESSTKLACAPLALRAWTIMRDSAVG